MASNHLHEECVLHPGRCVPVVMMGRDGTQRGEEGEEKQGKTGAEHDNPALLGMMGGAPYHIVGSSIFAQGASGHSTYILSSIICL